MLLGTLIFVYWLMYENVIERLELWKFLALLCCVRAKPGRRARERLTPCNIYEMSE